MSATINPKELKFVIFGAGYDTERDDSGEGEKIQDETLEMNALFASLDSTGQYCWTSDAGYSSYSLGIHKFDLEDDWNEVSQTVVPTNKSCILLHPVNIETNTAIAIIDNGSGADVVLFDMTDDSLIDSGTINTMPTINMYDTGVECIMVGDKVRFLLNNTLYTLDIKNYTLSQDTTDDNQIILLGFIDDTSIYAYRTIAWFSDYLIIYKYDMSLNIIWSEMAPQPSIEGFNAQPWGFGGNGYIYALSKMNGRWKLGEYKSAVAPDFSTPKPRRIICSFELNTQNYGKSVFSGAKKNVAFYLNGIGIYCSDFHENTICVAQASEFHVNYPPMPYCMNDDTLIAGNCAFGLLKAYKYR